MNRIHGLTLLWLIFAVGCAPSAGTNLQDVSNSGGSGSVQEIYLKDGTHCAILIGYYKGSISCNWKSS